MTPNPRFSVAVSTALGTVVALAGCGGGSSNSSSNSASSAQQTQDKAAVTQTLAALQAASRAGDGKRICNQIFTPKLANSVTASATSGSCAKEVRSKLFSPNATIKVSNITVTEPSDAAAVITEENGNTSKVFLVKQSGQWRIRGVRPA